MRRTTLRAASIGAATTLGVGAGMMLATPADADTLDRVAQCESGGDWSTSTGNGFHGGLQFTPRTWAGNGGHGSPEGASKAEQKRVARNVLKSQGPGAWPVCGPKAGLSSSDANGSQPTSKPRKVKTERAKTPKRATPKHAPKRRPAGKQVTVRAGDTLGTIAKRYGTSWRALYQHNRISDPNLIYPGQVLQV